MSTRNSSSLVGAEVGEMRGEARSKKQKAKSKYRFWKTMPYKENIV
jgi:hypothetical protein